MEYKIICSENIQEIELLEKDCFSDPWSSKSLNEIIADPNFACVAVVDNELKMMGYMIYSLIEDNSELLRIGVLKKYRRMGIGCMLMEYFSSDLIKHNIDKSFLEVRSNNIPAKALYTCYGFQKISSRKGYYSPDVDAVIMMGKIPLKRE